jgi:hypothetical protein
MSNIFLTNKLKEILTPSSTISESINVSNLLNNTDKKESKFITSTTVNDMNNLTSSASVGGSNKILSATSSSVNNKRSRGLDNFMSTKSLASVDGNNREFSATPSVNNKQSGGSGEFSATSSMTTGGNNREFSATSSINNKQSGGSGEFSATSPLSSHQNQHGGGGISATSSVVNKKSSGDKSINDVDHLISMLTTESDVNSVSTNKLESNIKQMLNNNMVGGENASANSIKNFFNTLRNNGMNVNIKLDDLTLTEFFDNGGTTMVGGARSLPPALVAFQKLKKLIAEELGITGRELITKASKIASAVKKDALDEGVEPAKHFKDNKDKYKKLYQKM